VHEIVEKIVRLYGLNVPIRFSGKKRPHEIMDTVADISKAKEKLGWEPEVDVDEGLKRVVDYYKET